MDPVAGPSVLGVALFRSFIAMFDMFIPYMTRTASKLSSQVADLIGVTHRVIHCLWITLCVTPIRSAKTDTLKIVVAFLKLALTLRQMRIGR